MPRWSPPVSGCRRCWRPALAFLAGGLIGAAAERVVVRRLYGRPLDAILATWGLSIVIGQLVTLAFGREVQFVPAPVSGTVMILGEDYSSYRLLMVAGGDRDRRPVHRAPQRHAARPFHPRRDHERRHWRKDWASTARGSA